MSEANGTLGMVADDSVRAPQSPIVLLAEELESVRAAAAVNRAAVVDLAAGLSREQLSWREEPSRWSVAEILDHLTKTVERCTPAVDKAISEARKDGRLSDGPFRQGIMGRLFVWYVEPPPKIRLPAPKALLPTNDSDPGCALSGYLRSQAAMLARVVAANGVDLRRARFQSPFTSLVRMDLLALFSVWAAHERRHIEQLRRVTKMMSSPIRSASRS